MDDDESPEAWLQSVLDYIRTVNSVGMTDEEMLKRIERDPRAKRAPSSSNHAKPQR
jgi:hypothetical protein